MIKTSGIDDKDLSFIINQTVNMRVKSYCSEDMYICRAVRRGRVLFPTYESVLGTDIYIAQDNTNTGVLVNGKSLNNIRYAVHTIMFADSLERLQELMNCVVDASSEYKLFQYK